MPPSSAADTIRILVSTDNHVGYNERDSIRGDDSWKTFQEIMEMARDRDVDMVLLAGDLFHENKPSRKSMYQVMRALRMNCLGDKPCELEMLSDASEIFEGVFNHVNYEDPDINVAIPVFSIHGNHDDPSGAGHLAALDLLQVSGLINYYGRTPESDNIKIKPVLLQKGRTKLALYGMSNVRDERLFRTFRDGNVKFFQPSAQKDEWFNLMSVHQNHFAHTSTGYLPENFLPDFMDLVIWGHEHECVIEPQLNTEMGFHVMQPGSSVATALMPGEAVTKHVAMLTITGKDFKTEPIRLKTVRPFIMKEVVLLEEPALKNLWKKDDNRKDITRHLEGIVNGMIAEAKAQWNEDHAEEDGFDENDKLPLVRLRVEYSAPEGGRFDCENPQRFSNRFVDKVANVSDVVQFYRKKKASRKRDHVEADMPDEAIMAQLAIDNIKVEKLVREFLTAQSLTILPQNSFGDAVSQFVDKDDKYAMEMFVNESLASQVKHLLQVEEAGDEDISEAMEQYRSKLEELFSAGHLQKNRAAKLKPKPEHWDSDLDGSWGDQPGALLQSEHEDDDDDASSLVSPPKAAARGRGRGRGARGGAASTRGKAAAAKASPKAPASSGRGRGKKRVFDEESEEEEDQDVVMLDDDDDEDDEQLFVKPAGRAAKQPATRQASTRSSQASTRASATQAKAAAKAPAKAAPKRAAAVAKQTTLNFSSQAATQPKGNSKKKAIELSDDEISDDDDAFEPVATTTTGRRKR